MAKALAKWVVPALALSVFLCLAVSSAMQKSATWDETHYLGLGAHIAKNLQWDVPSVLLHPPLPYYLNSIPFLVFPIDHSCFVKGKSDDILSGVHRGRCLLSGVDPAGDELLFWARLPTILLGALLGLFVYRWASDLYGTAGGTFSLLLYCLEPNILAHSRLITPDFPLAAFGFICVYYFWRMSRTACWKDTVLCGLFLGLALLSKYVGLMWVAILTALSVLASLYRPQGPPLAAAGHWKRGPVVQLGIIVILAAAVLLAGYGFRVSNYLAGLDIQRHIAEQFPPAFLNGEVSREGGWWYYHATAFFMKSTIPSLAMIAGLCVLWRRIRPVGGFDALCLLLPVMIFFVAFSFVLKVNLGLRYVLPTFPFLMVLSGGLTLFRTRKKSFQGLLLLPLLLWHLYEGFSTHPHYLAYFNQFAGGPEKGYRHLVDSNLDWGQDLKGLKVYMDAKGIAKVKLSYFGTADPAQYGIPYDPLPSFVLPTTSAEAPDMKEGDILAVSVTNLYPIYVDLGKLGEYLRSNPPKDHVGHSILIYGIERPFE